MIKLVGIIFQRDKGMTYLKSTRFICRAKKEACLENLICKRLKCLQEKCIISDYYFERQVKVRDKRLDLVIFLDSRMKVVVELKNPSKRWKKQRYGAIQQMIDYSEALPKFFEDVEIAIVTNGWKWEYSLKPFEDWKYINEVDNNLINVLSREALMRIFNSGE